MDDLISVIVPIYNVENYLRKCIESIVNQTHKNLQILLVDDGSSDQSGNICEEYALLDNRIKVIHKDNEGPASARKAGIALARGEYIGFVDADDYIDADFYQRLLSDIIENNVDFVHSAYITEDNGTQIFNNMYKTGIYELEDLQAEFIKAYILKMDSNVHMNHNLFSKLFRTDLIKTSDSVVPASQTRGEDMILVCSCILNSKRIFLDTEARYHYIIRSNSITHCNQMESVIDFADLYKCLINLFGQYGVLEKVRKDLEIYFEDLFLDLLARVSKCVLVPRYEFPNISDINGKRIVLYGAGKVGQNYYNHICKYPEIKIVAWADRKYEDFHFDYRKVIDRDSIRDYDFDLLIIAVLNESVAESIKKELVQVGISEDKIIWSPPASVMSTKK